MNKRDTWLAHYGIKGQKWGVKNGPPYPLDSQSKSASEKKGENKRSVQKATGKQICDIILSESGSFQLDDKQLDKSIELGKNKVQKHCLLLKKSLPAGPLKDCQSRKGGRQTVGQKKTDIKSLFVGQFVQ